MVSEHSARHTSHAWSMAQKCCRGKQEVTCKQEKVCNRTGCREKGLRQITRSRGPTPCLCRQPLLCCALLLSFVLCLTAQKFRDPCISRRGYNHRCVHRFESFLFGHATIFSKAVFRVSGRSRVSCTLSCLPTSNGSEGELPGGAAGRGTPL